MEHIWIKCFKVIHCANFIVFCVCPPSPPIPQLIFCHMQHYAWYHSINITCQPFHQQFTCFFYFLRHRCRASKTLQVLARTICNANNFNIISLPQPQKQKVSSFPSSFDTKTINWIYILWEEGGRGGIGRDRIRIMSIHFSPKKNSKYSTCYNHYFLTKFLN